MGVTVAFGIAACGGSGSGSSSASSEHVHEYVETETQAATCQAEGYKTLTCSCGDTKTETLQKLAHTEETVQAVPATCFSTGLTEGKRCSVCEEILVAQTQTAKLEHDFTKQDTAATYVATAATCQAKATYYYSCQHCGTAHDTNTFESGNFGACDFENAVHEDYLKAKATCVKRAEYYKSCSVCHVKSETETFFAGEKNTEHVWEESETVEIFETVEVSCFQDGYTVYRCTLCQKKYADMENLVPAPGEHTYTKAVTEPTCTEQGYTTYTCECGDSYSADYTDPAHKYTTTKVVDPTCSSQGYTLHICACEASYSDTYVAATGEHTSTERVSKEATCTETGEKEITYTCACNKTVTEEIPKIPHDFKNVKVVAPTCEEKGYTRHSCDCEEYYDDTFTAATGHLHYSESVKTQATCTEAGVKRFDCDACEYYYEEEIEATGHTFKAKATVAPTCDEKGYTQYACDCGVEGDKKDFVDATGHNYRKGTEIPATCEEKGYTQYICQNDPEHQYHVETEVLGHLLDDSWDLCVGSDGEEILVQVEGCTYYRTYKNDCERCGNEITKTENVTKHNSVAKITYVANCQDRGIKSYVCTVCNLTEKTEFYDAVGDGHQWQVRLSTEYTHQCGICQATKTVLGNKQSESVTVDKSALASTGEVQTKAASIQMDTATLNQLTGGTGSLDIHASTLSDDDKATTMSKLSEEEKAKLEGKDIFNFTVNNGAITKFDGKMTISVPYTLQEGEDADAIRVWYIDDEGNITDSEAKYEVIDGVGYAVFQTNHFSKYTVVRLTPSERCAIYDHDIKERTVAKTCTMDGYTMEYCIRCGYNNVKNVDKTTGHSYATKTVLPTCTKKGYTEYSCQLCDETYCDNFQDANGHSYETETVAPTCTKQGYTKHTCTVEGCGNTYNSEFVNATGHNFETETFAPTCTEQGYTTHTCTVEGCGYTYQSDATPATGHSYVADVITNPTCTEKGYTQFKCHCGREYTGEYKPAKGHKYDNGTKRDATCQQEGCTVYNCEDCDAYYEADKKPKTNHDYGDPVKHAPTCKEHGYDRHTCKHCDHYYDDNIKDKIAHDYEEVGVKEPTCTEKGYTIYVCKDPKCGSTINGNYVDQTKHNYGDDFICTECGALHPAAAVGVKGFYLTLHDSIANATGYFVTLENFTFKGKNLTFGGSSVAPDKPDGGYGDSSNSGIDRPITSSSEYIEGGDKEEAIKPMTISSGIDRESEVEIEVLKLTFAFDENGYIVGHGEFRVNVNNIESFNGKEIEREEEVVALKVIFVEGKVYAFTGLTDSDGEYENYIVMSQEYVQQAMGFPVMTLRNAFAKLYSEDARNIILAAMGVSSKTVDQALEAIMNFVFVQSETEEGYTFTLNADQLYNMAESIATKSVKELFDSFFGNGQLGKLFAYLNATLDKSIGGLEEEIAARLELQGYTIDDFYGIANDLAGMVFSAANSTSKFDLKALVAEYAEYDIGEMLSDATGMTVDEMKEMLGGIEEMCQTDSLVSIVLQMMGEAEDSDEATEMIDELLDMIKSYLKYIGETNITISTDKEGNAQTLRLKLDINIENDSFAAIITGNGTISFNDTYELNFGDLKEKIDGLLDTLKLKDGQTIESSNMYESDYTVYRHENGILVLHGNGLPQNQPAYQEENGTEEIDGVTYYKYSVMWDSYHFSTPDGYYSSDSDTYGYYYEESYGIMSEETCGDWIQYGLNCMACDVYFNVWLTEDGDIFKYEIDWETTKKNLTESEEFWLWYNPKTERYIKNSPHDYQIVDRYETDECEKTSWVKYECQYCKDSYTDSYTNSHEMEYVCELLEGATSCEDGYWEIGRCSKCDYERISNVQIGNGHMTDWEYVTLKTKCGGYTVAIVGCPCGGNFDVSLQDGSCEFFVDESFEKESRGRTWTCKYCGDVLKWTVTESQEGCYYTLCQTVTLNDEVIEQRTFVKANHKNTQRTTVQENGIIMHTDVCEDCQKTICVQKFNKNHYEIYYKNENGFGFYYEFDGCNYTRYVFTPTETFEQGSGVNHGAYRAEYSLSKGSETCLDGVDADYYCEDCNEHLYSQHNYMGVNHSFNVQQQVFTTPCGSVTFEYGVCACGEETAMGDAPVAVGCVMEMDPNTMAYVCAECGFRLEAMFEDVQNGCTYATQFEINAYQGGDVAIWTLTGKYSHTEHCMTTVNETDKDGNRVQIYKCENCSYFEYKQTWDQYGRELRYERANGSGYYYVYNKDCSYDYYVFDKYGNAEREYGGKESHVMRTRQSFLTDVKDCKAGVEMQYYCLICEKVLKATTYYGCQMHEQEIYATNTDCGTASFILYSCACGRESWGNLETGKSNCYFSETNWESFEDTETEYNRCLVTYTCMKCGYAYTRYTYSTIDLCTTYDYTVYSFGVEEGGCDYVHETCREYTNHQNIRREEGATDDGIYLYEEYCEACKTWFEHYEWKNDEFGRRIYYMDRLKGIGWLKEYSNEDCTYLQYELDQAGNKSNPTEGVEHAETRYRCELLNGSKTCEDGIRCIRYCPNCDAVVESWTSNGHNEFEHIEKLTTDCGTVYLSYHECACGEEKQSGVYYNGTCDLRQSNWEAIKDEYIDHEIRYYDCFVTDCGFRYTREYYYYFATDHSCMATNVEIYTFYLDDQVVFTRTVSWENHQIYGEYFEGTDKDGYPISVERCMYCDYVRKWDRFGREIYYWNPYDNWGREYTYTGCDYVVRYFDSNGDCDRGNGTNHIWEIKEIQQACTQYGTAINYCRCCGIQDKYEYVEPGHDYYWNEELQCNVCSRCGLENDKAVDGFFLVEDLTEQYGNQAYMAGFFNRYGLGWNMEEGYNFYIVLNYDEKNPENMIVTEGVKFELFEYGSEYGPEGSGIITLDMDSLNEAITKAFGENWEGFENVSIVFQYFDKECVNGEYSYLDHVLTFDRI